MTDHYPDPATLDLARQQITRGDHEGALLTALRLIEGLEIAFAAMSKTVTALDSRPPSPERAQVPGGAGPAELADIVRRVDAYSDLYRRLGVARDETAACLTGVNKIARLTHGDIECLRSAIASLTRRAESTVERAEQDRDTARAESAMHRAQRDAAIQRAESAERERDEARAKVRELEAKLDGPLPVYIVKVPAAQPAAPRPTPGASAAAATGDTSHD